MPNPMTDSFEGSLAALRPAPAGVGQASFYYRAGQVSRERAVRTWRLVGSTALALTLATAGFSAWRIHDAETRLAAAEARPIPTASAAPLEPALPPLPPSPSADEDLRPFSAPMVPPDAEDDMTPSEGASTLELRRNILTAGVTYLDAQSNRKLTRPKRNTDDTDQNPR